MAEPEDDLSEAATFILNPLWNWGLIRSDFALFPRCPLTLTQPQGTTKLDFTGIYIKLAIKLVFVKICLNNIMGKKNCFGRKMLIIIRNRWIKYFNCKRKKIQPFQAGRLKNGVCLIEHWATGLINKEPPLEMTNMPPFSIAKPDHLCIKKAVFVFSSIAGTAFASLPPARQLKLHSIHLENRWYPLRENKSITGRDWFAYGSRLVKNLSTCYKFLIKI